MRIRRTRNPRRSISSSPQPGQRVFSKPPTIPGPLIRVRVGTPVRVTIRNPLDDTLVVRGFGERASARDSLVVLPGATTGVSYVARHEGTYLYWVLPYTVRVPDTLRATNLPPIGFDSQRRGIVMALWFGNSTPSTAGRGPIPSV